MSKIFYFYSFILVIIINEIICYSECEKSIGTSISSYKDCEDKETGNETIKCCFLDVNVGVYEHQKACVGVVEEEAKNNYDEVYQNILEGKSEIDFVYHMKVDKINEFRCDGKQTGSVLSKNKYLFLFIFTLIFL